MEKDTLSDRNVNRGLALLYCTAFIFINVFVFNFISRERYIYYWDYEVYWAKYQHLGEVMEHSPVRVFYEVWHSIQRDDYNFLPVFFLMPFRFFFGDSRLAYILAVTNIYVFPAAVLCSVLVRKIAGTTSNKDALSITALTLSTFLLFPQFWIPVFFGYPDSAGVGVILTIFLVLFLNSFEDMSSKELFALGALLSLLVLLRRWYAYWVVTFFIALVPEQLSLLIRQHGTDFRNYRKTVRNGVMVGVISLGLLFLFAAPMAIKMISTNYADMYSAYKSAGSLQQVLIQCYRHFGPAVSVLFVISTLSGLMSERTRPIFIIVTVQFVAIILLFSRTQDFNSHHYYLLMPSMIISFSVFLSNVLGLVKNLPLRLTAALGCAVVMFLHLLILFVPGALAGHSGVGFFTSSQRHYPLVRNDLDEIKRILDVMDRQENVSGIYVAASSLIINDDMLKSVCVHATKRSGNCEKIYISSNIDKRDGFPRKFLDASHIIVADPVQYHLRPEDQRVVGILAEDILTEKGIGVSFKRLAYEFSLDNNAKAYIYRKIKPLDEAGLKFLENRFLAYYPQYRDIFLIKSK